MSTLFQRFSIIQQNQHNQQYQQNQPHKIYLKIKSKHNSTKIFKNFKIFQKNITIQKFLKINVPRFLEIHGP